MVFVTIVLIGTSLLALKKSSKQTLDGPLKAPSKLNLDLNEGSSNLVGGSRVEEMEVGNDADVDVLGNDSNNQAETFERNEVEKVVEKRKSRSRPSSPIPNIFKSVFNQKTDDSNAKDKDVSLKPVGDRDEKKNTKSRPSSPLPRMLKSVFNHKPDGETKNESGCNLKSFRLGIPSLFPKKKSSKDLLKEGSPLSMETTSELLNAIDKVPSSTALNNKPPSQNDSSSVLKTCSSIEDVGQSKEENPLNCSEVKDIGTEKLLDKSDDENNDSFFRTQDSNLNFDFFGKEPAEEEANENFFGKGNDGDAEDDFDFFGKGKEDANETEGNDNFFGNGSEGDKEANFDFFGSGSTKEDDGNNDFFSFASGGNKHKDDNPFSFF